MGYNDSGIMFREIYIGPTPDSYLFGIHGFIKRERWQIRKEEPKPVIVNQVGTVRESYELERK